MGFANLFRMIDNPQHSFRLQAACGCDQGKKRKNNEDNFYFNGEIMGTDNHGMQEILRTSFSSEEDAFLSVFDGMGGGDFGEVASYTAARTTKSYLEEGIHINPCDITPSLAELCRKINREVYSSGRNLGTDRTGSTLAGLYFHEGQVWSCNLGDSRAFLLRNGKLYQISRDHTDAEFMEENGITGRKPYLTQYLGIDPEEMELVPYIRSIYLRGGDRFLISSDGVTDMVEEQKIQAILKSGKDTVSCVQTLIRTALDEGGRDNITAIVADVL